MTLGATINRTTRFLLATLLWGHAFFLVNVRSQLLFGVAQRLHLTSLEFVFLGLVILFSYLAGTGFWSGVGNFAYIYFFPFVIIFYLAKLIAKSLLIIGRWLNPSPPQELLDMQDQQVSMTPLGIDSGIAERRAGNGPGNGDRPRFWTFLLRPFRRFTILWCLLLMVATHAQVIGVALIVVLIHITRTVVRLVRVSFFSKTFFSELERMIAKNVDDTLVKLRAVTEDAPASPELRVLWQSVHNFEVGVRALGNQVLVSRWAMLISAVFLGIIYVYIAFVFSFAYYGIERLTGGQDTWPQLLITSLFIPFFVAGLPKMAGLMLLGGLQCALVVSVGIGTLSKYLRVQLQSLKTVATIVDVKLSDEQVKGKYDILRQKFERSPNNRPNHGVAHPNT